MIGTIKGIFVVNRPQCMQDSGYGSYDTLESGIYCGRRFEQKSCMDPDGGFGDETIGWDLYN